MLSVVRRPVGITEPSARLDKRIRLFSICIAIVLLVLSPITGIASKQIMPPLAALLGAFVIFIMVRSEDDIFIVFFVQSPSITYTLTTLLFALFTGNISLTGMYDADRAFLIVALYQVSIFAAYGALKLATYPGKIYDVCNDGFFNASYLTIFALVGSIMLVVIRLGGFGKSLIQNIVAACWLAVALAALSYRKGLYKPAFAIVAVTFLSLSLFANQRTFMFSIALFTIFFYLTHANKAISFFRMLAFVVAGFSLGIISQAFINARPNDSTGVDPVQVLSDTLNEIASADAWISALPDLSNEHEQDYIQLRSAYFSRFLQGGLNAQSDSSNSIGARLAQIGHMDIVTAKYPLRDRVDVPMWTDQLMATATASPEGFLAPLYSDELVWNLGLRPRPLVGRPLVSVAGELYMLSGIYWFPVITFVIFVIFIGQAMIFRAAVGYSSAYVISLIMATFPIIFTGTAFGLLNTVGRMLPVLIIIGWAFKKFTYQRISNQTVIIKRGIFTSDEELGE